MHQLILKTTSLLVVFPEPFAMPCHEVKSRSLWFDLINYFCGRQIIILWACFEVNSYCLLLTIYLYVRSGSFQASGPWHGLNLTNIILLELEHLVKPIIRQNPWLAFVPQHRGGLNTEICSSTIQKIKTKQGNSAGHQLRRFELSLSASFWWQLVQIAFSKSTHCSLISLTMHAYYTIA